MKLFVEHLQLSFQLVLAPRVEISEFPLQNFYRFVSTSSLEGGDVHSLHELESRNVAQFEDLPRQHVLTTRLDTPQPWNVQSAVAYQVRRHH